MYRFIIGSKTSNFRMHLTGYSELRPFPPAGDAGRWASSEEGTGMTDDSPENSGASECVVPPGPLPAETLGRYSVERDPIENTTSLRTSSLRRRMSARSTLSA